MKTHPVKKRFYPATLRSKFSWGTALMLCVSALGAPPLVQAQTLFQNNNAACESKEVLCGAGGTCADGARSVACKNIEDSVDFDGDGFVDCVASTTVSGAGGELIASVLLNQGLAATSCAGGSGDQFQPASNYSIDFLNTDTGLSSVVAGNLNNTNFDDFALADINSSVLPGPLVSAFSLPGGGFGPDGTAIPNSDSSSVDWSDPLAPGQIAYQSDESEKNMALFDCDDDGDLDNVIVSEFVVTVAMQETHIGFANVNRNDGGGLVSFDNLLLPGQDFVTAAFAPVPVPSGDILQSVAIGDFDGANGQDVAVAVNSTVPGGPSGVVVCLNDGACGFPALCTPAVNLFNDSPGSGNSFPFSIGAGDFNDDGNDDIVVSTQTELVMGSQFFGMQYFFGNGDGSFQTPGTDIAFTGGAIDQNGTPRALTTGCFNNDNVVDVATLVSSQDNVQGASDIRVVTSDGSGAFNDPVVLSFGNLAVGPFTADGIDAADFDNGGGDDIMALATYAEGVVLSRSAYVFMNTPEDFVADAGPNQVAGVNVPLEITGASCTANPDNPDDPAVFDIQWTVNPSEGVTLENADQINPTLTATSIGNYTLTLECRTRCDVVVTDTKTITVQENPPPTPTPVPTASPSPSASPSPTSTPIPGSASTQGGCVASLNPKSGQGIGWVFFAMLPGLFLGLRRSRQMRRVGFSLLVLGLLLVSSSSYAMSTSFSVNTFEPTVDDSDYFQIYGSETMLQRNFHVGFFLDYAHHPYEFGNPNFDRVSGVVDHLLTGNVVGSYGIFDWMSAGLVIPVYFYEGISSSLLGLNENNTALGDVKLVLKFRLLDLEKHRVGIAIVPMLSFPSSTDAGAFLGNGSFSGGAKVVVDGRIGDRVSLALNLGYNARDRIVDVGGNDIDDEFFAGLGISVEVIKYKLRAIVEGLSGTVVHDFYSEARTVPVEARLGFRYTFANNHDVNVGGGLGLSHGIGQPDYRILLGYTYTKRPLAEVSVPPPAMNEIQVGDELTLKDKIYFDFDKATIRDISKPTLDKIAGFLKAHPEVTKIRIDGYTCDLGRDSYNLRLSQRRAQAVAEYLEGQGVSSDRVGMVKGYGEANPLVPNTDEANREQNRRVQIFVEAVDPGLAQGSSGN